MKNIKEIFDLTGKVALITGGAGLLGGRFCSSLAEAGATVYAIDVSLKCLEARSLEWNIEVKPRIQPLVLDITNEIAVIETVETIYTKHQKIDILINSAAIDPKFDTNALSKGESPGAFTMYSLENWQRSMDVNLTGAFLMSREVCRYMERRDNGVIVNISSTYGLVGPDQRIYERKDQQGNARFFKPVDYSVTKAGMLGFTRALAAYYQGKGIRVNALSPGGTFNGNPDEFVEKYCYRTISNRMATPDDYTGAIVFLCSDASNYMTGANLVVDGGWTAL